MKILLVYPRYPDTFWSFRYALRFIGKKASFPPLGLLTVAAMLPSAWDRKLVDMNVRALTDADLAWADCVFLSAMDIQRQSAQEVIARCQRLGIRTVAGGPLFSSCVAQRLTRPAQSRGQQSRAPSPSGKTHQRTIIRSSTRKPHTQEEQSGNDHDQGQHADLLQGLGRGQTRCFQPWLAALGRRLGEPDGVPGCPWLSLHCP